MMLTPKDIQEAAFNRVAFGGYDMQAVDELLETVTADYETLYKENSVLKSKLKVLVEKLEDYREQETGMKRALVAAQQTSDSLIADAQKRAGKILNDAEASAAKRIDNANESAAAVLKQAEAEAAAKLASADNTLSAARSAASRSAEETKAALTEEFATEQLRVDRAKSAAQRFITILERELATCSDTLEKLRTATGMKREEAPAPAPRPEPAPVVKEPEPEPAPAPAVEEKPDFSALWTAPKQEINDPFGLEDDLAAEIQAKNGNGFSLDDLDMDHAFSLND